MSDSESSDIFDKSENKSVDESTSVDDQTSSSVILSDDKSVSFIKLFDKKDCDIENIYHLSDIHIRNDSRHKEYEQVFNRLYKYLSKDIGSNNESSLIVLTGNLMHTRTELSPDSFTIAKNFLSNLVEICPVIIMAGNHDCHTTDSNKLDAITPIVSTINSDRLHYVRASGIYQYANLIIGVTTVHDRNLVTSNKITKEIFSGVKHDTKYKIALFHGLGIDAKYFDGYDYVLLGGDHEHKFLDRKRCIGYAGSLIQQLHAESLENHGLIKWNIASNESANHVEINNDYGFCTIDIVDGKMIDTRIPKRPYIIFRLNNTTNEQYKTILADIEQKHQIQQVIVDSVFKTKQHRKSDSSNAANGTQMDIIRQYLSLSDISDSDIESIIDLHTDISEELDNDPNKLINLNNNDHNKWSIDELRFSNTLVYGKDNVIDFRKYGSNRIIGISAPNRYGKSSILDIILFCLFEKFSRGDRRDIIHTNEKSMSCSLLFTVQDKQYMVERTGKRGANDSVKIEAYLYHIKPDGSKKCLNGVDKTETNKRISDLIGDYNDYLTT